MNISSSNDDRSILEMALYYASFGWSVIPIRPGSKAPQLKSWKPYAEKAPSEAELRKWFKDDDVGIAVCLGEASGGLACRDFDDVEAYLRWLDANDDLASLAPTSQTSRGYHVFFEVTEDAVESVSPTGSSIVIYGDGELRGSGYVVLPPSVHESGHVYRWDDQPVEVPYIRNLEASGLAQSWLEEDVSCWYTKKFTNEDKGVQKSTDESRGSQRTTEDYQCQEADSDTGHEEICEFDLSPWSKELGHAIDQTQPAKHGQRNRCLFELARKIKGIPALAELAPLVFEDVVRVWFDFAQDVIRTKSFEESLCDFCRGWDKVKLPAGATLVNQWNEAMDRPFPQCSERFSPDVQRLVALCERLHWTWDPQPFPLACRPAGKLLSVSHLTASLWLDILVRYGVLELVSKGGPNNRRASKYRYLGDLVGDPDVPS